MSNLFAVFTLAARRLARRPGLTSSVVLTLALGIAANATIFGVVRAVLLRPLPVPAPEELMFITREGDVSLLDATDWRRESKTFSAIALFLRNWSLDVVGPEGARRLRASVTEPDYFAVLQVPALLGRGLGPADGRAGAPAVAVISERLWRDDYNGDPKVIGSAITLSDVPTTVVGVMPTRFDVLGDGIDLWVAPAPFVPWALAERGTNNFDAIGRRHSTASAAAASAELRGISERFATIYPQTNTGKIVVPLPLHDFLVRNVRPALLAIQLAAALLMLLATLHLGGMMLARAVARRSDFATRLALGASRRQLIGEIAAEATLLAAAGAVAGVVLSRLGYQLLIDALPAGVPRLAAINAEGGQLGLGVAIAVVSTIVLATLVASGVLAEIGRGPLGASDRGGTAGRGRRRLLGAVVVSELAAATLLLVAAGLLVRSFQALSAVPVGVDTTAVTVASLILPESRYGTRETQTPAIAAIVENLAAIPGVEAAAFVTGAPLEPRGGIGHPLEIEGLPPLAQGRRSTRHRPVLGDYFAASGHRLLAGRSFVPTDDENGEPVAIVNQRFVDLFLDGKVEAALDRRISFVDSNQPGPWMRIVGVAADVRSTTLDAADTRAVYTPYRQRQAWWIRFGSLLVRGGDPATLPAAMAQAVAAVDATVPLDRIEPLAARRDVQLAQPAFQSRALLLFAGLGLLLATQGIFATLAFAVTERRRELAVRAVLGAAPRALLADVIGRAAVLGGLGLGIGLLGAVAISRLLAALLFGVGQTDPTTYISVAAVLAGAALLAAVLPGLMAARTDPAVALRQDG